MRTYWIENLPGMPSLPPCAARYNRPDRASVFFVENGYFVEYFEYPFDRNRTVALLYGPGEFIVRTHPVYSTIQALDKACAAEFSYGDIFRTLRNFPEARVHYRAVREMHLEKVADRLRMAGLESAEERLRFVRERQGWVLKKVPENIVAGYLGVGAGVLKDMRNL